jgi:hypothetical protein
MRLNYRAQKGVEKTRAMLVQICRDDGKVEEEDADASMLSDSVDSKEVAVEKDQQMTNGQEISASRARLTLQVTFTS